MVLERVVKFLCFFRTLVLLPMGHPLYFLSVRIETEIEGLRSMKKPYPSSYRKPHFVRTIPTKRAVVVTIWSNDFVLPALVLLEACDCMELT